MVKGCIAEVLLASNGNFKEKREAKRKKGKGQEVVQEEGRGMYRGGGGGWFEFTTQRRNPAKQTLETTRICVLRSGPQLPNHNQPLASCYLVTLLSQKKTIDFFLTPEYKVFGGVSRF